MLKNTVQSLGITNWSGAQLPALLHKLTLRQNSSVAKGSSHRRLKNTLYTNLAQSWFGFCDLFRSSLYTLSTGFITKTTNYIN